MVNITINGKQHTVRSNSHSYYDIVRLAYGDGNHPLMTIIYGSKYASGALRPSQNSRDGFILPLEGMTFEVVKLPELRINNG